MANLNVCLFVFLLTMLIHALCGKRTLDLSDFHSMWNIDKLSSEVTNDSIERMQVLVQSYVHNFAAKNLYGVIRKQFKFINFHIMIEIYFNAIVNHKSWCISGIFKEIFTSQSLIERAICLHSYLSGVRNNDLTLLIMARQDHMINVTIDHAHVQHSINCNSDFIGISYGNHSRTLCGHVLYETLYIDNNIVTVEVITEYTERWFIDIQYQVHAKGYAYRYDRHELKPMPQINFSFSPSFQLRERKDITHMWYFNLPLSYQTELIYKYSKTMLTISNFKCEDLGTWLIIQNGLMPIVWMKLCTKTLSCFSQMPQSYGVYQFKHITMMLTIADISNFNISMGFTQSTSQKILDNYIKSEDVQEQTFLTSTPYGSFQLACYSVPPKYIHFIIESLQYSGPYSHVNVSYIHNVIVPTNTIYREFLGKNFMNDSIKIDN